MPIRQMLLGAFATPIIVALWSFVATAIRAQDGPVESRATMVGASRLMTITWSRFDCDEDDLNTVEYIVDGTMVGSGEQGFSVVLSKVKGLAPGAAVEVYPDALAVDVPVPRGCGLGPDVLLRETVPFRTRLRDFRAFCTAVSSRSITVRWFPDKPSRWGCPERRMITPADPPENGVSPGANAGAKQARCARLETRNPKIAYGSDVLNVQGEEVVDSELQDLKAMPWLVRLNIFAPKVTNAGLANLKRLTCLEELHLRGMKNCSDAALANLRDCTRLRILDLDGMGITGSGLGDLKQLKELRKLCLANTLCRDEELGHLRHFERLRQLDLVGTCVSDDGLTRLKDLNLFELRLGGRRSRISDTGVVQIKELLLLRSLDLADTEITSQAFRQLGTLVLLRYLSIPSRGLNRQSLDELRKVLPRTGVLVN